MIENTAIQPELNQLVSQHYPCQDTAAAGRRGQVTATEDFRLATDTVSLSYSSEPVTTYDSTMTLQSAQNDGFDLLRGLVMNIFKEQGLSLDIPLGTNGDDPKELSLEEISRQEAEELVAEDGYFGVEQTSARIADLAIGIAGGDPARIEAIKAGVEQGFNEALEAFGGWLPDISHTTYETIMEKLDGWADDIRTLHP